MSDSDEMDGINIVPLVDVMLVLLTIVLTTATFVVNGRIPVDLAKSSTATSAQPAPLVLTATAQQVLYLNDQPVTNLASALAAYPHSTPVVVRADGQMVLAAFVELVDKVKALGFAQVSLEVKRV
ncbi:biopolymer transporter ExbD [Ottowia testudinis]|uniref:Biopolymer transporter ExbD n=1 Tax=Ottowia testudinis TaxID=2816950 RepID=A0A975CJ29_9BURK|nr:biopolymer transporter ExbD [Ottowia testudinis]QTD44338.1 biopolymer transporter ExbD [Ottowia testudinis]